MKFIVLKIRSENIILISHGDVNLEFKHLLSVTTKILEKDRRYFIILTHIP